MLTLLLLLLSFESKRIEYNRDVLDVERGSNNVGDDRPWIG